jgi:hypothetical protein
VPATKKKSTTKAKAKAKKVLPVKAEKKAVKAKPAVASEKQTKLEKHEKKEKAGDKFVTIDRRRSPERRGTEKATEIRKVRTPVERRAKVNRRRQIDPTTCERDYSLEEIEFMRALDDYKRANGRMFPTCSEVLEVIHKLGYEKRTLAVEPISIGETVAVVEAVTVVETLSSASVV